MSILYATTNKKTAYPFAHDPQEKLFYTFGWRPPIWESGKEYLVDDAVVPTVSNGFYYRCVAPGVSDVLEPTFSFDPEADTLDGASLLWRAVPYDLKLRSGEVIEVSTFTATDGVELDSAAKVVGLTWVRVISVPSGLTKFELTNTIDVRKVDGNLQRFERTLVIPIKQL